MSKALDFLGLDALAPARTAAPALGGHASDDDDRAADMTSALMGGKASAKRSAASSATAAGHSSHDNNDDDDDDGHTVDDDDDAKQIERASAKAIRNETRQAKRKASGADHGPGKKSGGFQSMGLAPWLLRAILLRNFHLPTPIQRAAIPAILAQPARDVVAMARTGSGKTLAYVVPLLQLLGGRHRSAYGARALVIVPSRELAMQVLRVAKDLGRGKRTGSADDDAMEPLRFCLLTGGDSLEDDFAKLAANPDVIIATPGRLLHVVVEADVALSSVEYAVFDEADRLFELGLAEQLDEIIARLPPTRQTVLCSATLPRSLVQFARAGLQNNPRLVRLDAEAHISDALQMAFFSAAPDTKEALLLCLLRNVIGVPFGRPDKQATPFATGANKPAKPAKKPARTLEPWQTVVFCATKHHVEYYHTLLTAAGWATGALYSSLDQSARLNEMAKFQAGKTSILVVTDVAARGIDLPLLGHVVNLDIPPQPRTFVHRVGRTARAGATGWAYTIVSTAELAYFADLAAFLSRSVVRTPWAPPAPASVPEGSAALLQSNLVIGTMAPDDVEAEVSFITSTIPLRSGAAATDLMDLKRTAAKAQKMYERSRPQPTPAGYKKAKAWSTDAHDASALPRVAQAAEQQAKTGAPGDLGKLPLPLVGAPAAETGVHMVYARPDLFGLGQTGEHTSNARTWGASRAAAAGDGLVEPERVAADAAEAAARAALLAKLSAFSPSETVLETGRSIAKGVPDETTVALMRKRRSTLAQARIRRAANEAHEKVEAEAQAELDPSDGDELEEPAFGKSVPQTEAAEEEIEEVFGTRRPLKKARTSRMEQLVRPQKGAFKDASAYVTYTPRGDTTDSAGMFVAEANAMAEDAMNDEGGRAAGQRAGDSNQRPNARRWDTTSKKFVRADQRGQDNVKLIKTESGTRLPASYRSGRYDAWAKHNRMNIPRVGQAELNLESAGAPSLRAALEKTANMTSAPGGKGMKHMKLTPPQDPLKRQKWNPAARQERDVGSSGPAKTLAKGSKKKILPNSGHRTGSGGRNEIKSAQDIHKQRAALAQRKAKNARKPGASKGKGKGRR